jgi:hypothetical protein
MQLEKRHQIESNFPCEHTTSCAQRQPYLPGFKGVFDSGASATGKRNLELRHPMSYMPGIPARSP